MKKNVLTLFIAATCLYACNKSDGSQNNVSLTASTTETTVGQTISVTASTSSNALAWSASPSSSATKAYSVTTEKTNYFTFTKAGEYVIGVRARNLLLDSVHKCNLTDSIGHHVPDSIWHHHIDSMWHFAGHHLGGCRKGQDSASIVIKVK
jgi:hypothetical protein